MAYSGTYQYITYNRRRHPEVFYIEGTYDERFLAAMKAIVPYKARRWDAENKRWEIQREYLDKIKAIARDFFDRILFSEGGDYVEL